MWKLSGTPTIAVVSQDLIREFKGLPSVPGDRPFSEFRAAQLKREILAGRFRTAQFSSVLCRETGATYRVNGKHTVSVMAEMNGELPPLHAEITRYEADTLADVADLYATFDSYWSRRNTSDLNYSVAQSDPDLKALDLGIVNAVVSGIAFLRFDRATGTQRDLHDRSRLILSEKAFAFWYRDMVADVPRRTAAFGVTRRSSVVAAMFGTWHCHPETAAKFWSKIKDPKSLMLDPESYEAKLARYLYNPASSRAISRSTKTITAGAQYIASIKCWNAIRGGKQFTLLVVHPGDSRPDPI